MGQAPDLPHLHLKARPGLAPKTTIAVQRAVDEHKSGVSRHAPVHMTFDEMLVKPPRCRQLVFWIVSLVT